MLGSDETHREVERTVYTRDYAGYRADPVFEKTVRLVLKSHISPLKPPPADILDVGCGAGDFLDAAKEMGYSVQGIDVSEASAEICRSRGFDAVSGDYLSHDFEKRFDLVTMWDVIEHLRDPGSFFKRTRRILGPGGIFFGKVPGFGNLSVETSRHVPRLAGLLLGAPALVQYLDQRSLSRLAEREGFEIQWLSPALSAMRQRQTGGSLKRRVGRTLARAFRRLSGDANLYFVARPRPEGEAPA